jgi:hypothetical protein
MVATKLIKVKKGFQIIFEKLTKIIHDQHFIHTIKKIYDFENMHHFTPSVFINALVRGTVLTCSYPLIHQKLVLPLAQKRLYEITRVTSNS